MNNKYKIYRDNSLDTTSKKSKKKKQTLIITATALALVVVVGTSILPTSISAGLLGALLFCVICIVLGFVSNGGVE